MKCTASRGRSPLLAADAGQAHLRGEPLSAGLALRAVHRAAAELRRGTPVLLTGSSTLVLVAAETAQAGSLAEFTAVCEGPPLLLLSPVRAAAVLGQPEPPTMDVVALRLAERLLTPEMLRALADVTAHQPRTARPEEAPAPSLAPAALALAKLGRLLPAVLAAPFRADAADLGARIGLLSVSAGDVLAYPKAAASALRRVAEARVPLDGAEDARVVAFRA